MSSRDDHRMESSRVRLFIFGVLALSILSLAYFSSKEHAQRSVRPLIASSLVSADLLERPRFFSPQVKTVLAVPLLPSITASIAVSMFLISFLVLVYFGGFHDTLSSHFETVGLKDGLISVYNSIHLKDLWIKYRVFFLANVCLYLGFRLLPFSITSPAINSIVRRISHKTWIVSSSKKDIISEVDLMGSSWYPIAIKSAFQAFEVDDFSIMYKNYSKRFPLNFNSFSWCSVVRMPVYKIENGQKLASVTPKPVHLPKDCKYEKKFEIAGMDKMEQKFVWMSQDDPCRWQALFGEDSAGMNKQGNVFVLSDGVGGSQLAKMCSSLLVNVILDHFDEHPGDDLFKVGPLMIDHIVEFLESFSNNASSSTLIAVQLTPQSGGVHMKALNVGDSICSVVNPKTSTMIFETVAAEHFENCPLQISSYGYSQIHEYEFFVPHGHIIYLYSDGVADNLYPASISSVKSAVDLVALSHQMYTEGCDFPIPFSTKLSTHPETKTAEGKFLGKKDDLSCISIKI